MRSEHKIGNLTSWAEEIAEAIRAFKTKHGACPHLVAFSPVTLRRVAMVASNKPQHLKGRKGPIRKFVTKDCEVLLVEEDDMPEGHYALVRVAESSGT